jgi:hypothetical protein
MEAYYNDIHRPYKCRQDTSKPMNFRLNIKWKIMDNHMASIEVENIEVDVSNNKTWQKVNDITTLFEDSVYSPSGIVPDVFEDLSNNITSISVAFSSSKIGQNLIKYILGNLEPDVQPDKSDEEITWGLDASSVSLSNFSIAANSIPDNETTEGKFSVECHANRIPLHFYYFILDTDGNLVSVDSTEKFFSRNEEAILSYYKLHPTLDPNE